MKCRNKRPFRLEDNVIEQIMLYQCTECGSMENDYLFGGIKMNNELKGCNECKDFWQFSNVKFPQKICSNDERQASLYRCPKCLLYWEESQRFAYILSNEELHEFYSVCCNKSDVRII